MTRWSRWVLLAVVLAAPRAGAEGTIKDYYGPRIEWRQASGFEVTPIHAGLLPDGRLFFLNSYSFFQHPEVDLAEDGFDPEFLFLMQPTPLGSAPPASMTIRAVKDSSPLMLDPEPRVFRMKTFSCGGHALMADGGLFFASGAAARVDLDAYDAGRLADSLTIDGIADSLTYHPSAGTWTVNASMVGTGPSSGMPQRWYATVTRLADSRMLVTGGYERVYPLSLYNPSVEVFDPAANAWTTVSAASETPPGIENPDYTHVFQHPGANGVVMIGGSGEPMFLDLANHSWMRSYNFRPGAKEHIAAVPYPVFPNHGSSSALLPLRLPEDGWGYSNGSVLYAGGEYATELVGHVDVYDPGINRWRPSIAMHARRHDPAAVLLPDGRVLLLAGHDTASTDSVGFAEYIDPRNNFALSQGIDFMPEVRAYHSVAVLLPDGRVLVGSGNVSGDDGIEHDDFRYYHPDYISKPRPRILSAPATLAVGGSASIAVPHRAAVGEAALMGLGAMTHAFDMNQRHVQLRLSGPTSTERRSPLGQGQWLPAMPAQCAANPAECRDLYTIQAPPSPQIAPPGYYMLFILDRDRVPSTAAMVRLQ